MVSIKEIMIAMVEQGVPLSAVKESNKSELEWYYSTEIQKAYTQLLQECVVCKNKFLPQKIHMRTCSLECKKARLLKKYLESLEKRKQFRKENPEIVHQRDNLYYEKTKKKRSISSRKYYKRNKELLNDAKVFTGLK